MKVDGAASAREAHLENSPAVSVRRRPVLVGLALLAVLIPTVVLRFTARPNLWLDEALTINIAKLPLDQLRAALAHDGAPPLYYVLLHGWISIFGSSDAAVRALSGVLGVAAIGIAYVAGRRIGASAVRRGWLSATALVVVAASPYAMRYSTEARMYSLTILLVLLGVVVVANAWERLTLFHLAGVSLVAAGLLYTQYWSFFLVGLVGVGLVVMSVRARSDTRRRARRLLVAIAVGGLLFVPWLPTLRTQLAHTGTPWDAPARPIASTWHALVAFGGGRVVEGWLLAGVLVCAGVFAVATRGTRRAVPVGATRTLAALGLVTLFLGIGVSALTENGFQDRYAAVAFPLVGLVAAIGIVAVGDVRARVGILVFIAVLGVIGGVRAAREVRTASGAIARVLRPALGRGDVVAYCPDQLGPSTSRLLPSATRQVTFPRLDAPQFVDWTDYAARNAVASPTRVARLVTERAGAARVWLVWSPGYRTLGTKCEGVVNALLRIRPHADLAVAARGPRGETVELRRFDR